MVLKIGCCGFPMAKRAYYELFEVVEIQKTFYNPPRLETARKWQEEVPADFEFTAKSWQLITHPPSSPTHRKANLKITEEKQGSYGFFNNIHMAEDALRFKNLFLGRT